MPNDQANNPNPTPTPPPTTSSTQSTPSPLPNDPAARTPQGELIDQGAKPNDSAAPAGTDPANSAKGPDNAVPDSYTFQPTADGQPLDAESVAEITPVFKELGLSQDQADKLIGFHNKQMEKLQTKLSSEVMTMREGWRNELKADKEIGGKLEQVAAEIGKAKAVLGPELSASLNEAMDLTGAGDHPAFIKAFYKFAQLVNEGKPVSPGNPSPFGQKAPGAAARPSAAQSLYPNLPSQS